MFLLDLLNWAMIGKRHSHLSRLRPGPLFYIMEGDTVHYITTTGLFKIIHRLNLRDTTVQLKPSKVA